MRHGSAPGRAKLVRDILKAADFSKKCISKGYAGGLMDKRRSRKGCHVLLDVLGNANGEVKKRKNKSDLVS